MNVTSNKSSRQKAFEEYRKDYTDRDIEMEKLYFLRLIQDSNEKTKSNTSIISWFIIIGLACSLIAAFMTFMV